jgi:chromosome segregation ATPase
MRETPTAPPASPEIPVDIASRLIAPLRSKEQRNVERLENENAKFKHTILEILKSGERSEQLVTEQEVAIKKLREENASIRKLNLEAKMADEKRLEEQEAHIANLQKRNEAAEDKAVEIAANHLAAVMDELRSSNRNLELQNESLNADIDSMRVRLEAAEKRLTETSASYRHAQTTINNSNATISKFEHHIDEVQAKLENARQELGIKDSRIKAKDNDLSNTAAEVANLNSLNKELQVKNRRLISQNEKLELQAQHNNAEIDALRQASRDYLELESALAEAQTTITKVRDEIVSLEQSNAELRARAEEYTTFPRTRGTINNLESELSGSGFHGTDQDTLFTAPTRYSKTQ